MDCVWCLAAIGIRTRRSRGRRIPRGTPSIMSHPSYIKKKQKNDSRLSTLKETLFWLLQLLPKLAYKSRTH